MHTKVGRGVGIDRSSLNSHDGSKGNEDSGELHMGERKQRTSF
jgi:hypothetical protein